MVAFSFPWVNAPRLVFVATADHLYTPGDIPDALARRGVRCSVWSWDRLFRARSLPRATYILTDFDRLAPGPLEIGARFYKRLVAENLLVLNDPRRFRNRAQLIGALQAAGLNDYGCVQPATGAWPDRYPVFLRANSAHRGIMRQLITTRQEAEFGLQRALKASFLLSDLVFIDYCAEAVAETGHFQKHAALRVGDALIRANTVNDAEWAAKRGTANLATAAQYAAERAEYDDWPHRDFVARVFDIAAMDFGRVDFGIARGRPQAYEVNTNPVLKISTAHANADRRITLDRYRTGILDSLGAIATPSRGKRITVSDLFRPAPRAVLRRPVLF